MLKLTLRARLMGLAVMAGLFGCAHQDNGGVSATAAKAAKEVGARLAAQDRKDEQRHRAALAKLMRLGNVSISERDRSMTIAFDARNLSSKKVTRFDTALLVRSPDGSRIATTELHASASLAGHSIRRIIVSIPYTQFGSDTGAMREAVGKPQRYALDVKEIKYADGSDAGYDD